MCTAIRFTDDKGQMYLARNLDWSCGYGERVVVTPRGFKPNSPFGAVTGMREPVIGMGIVEEGMPLYFDCANASGLAVAGLNFPATRSTPTPRLRARPTLPPTSSHCGLWPTSRPSTRSSAPSMTW